MTRVVVIANIYAPYRVPTLRELGRWVDLRILFSAATEPNREWAVPDRMPFRSEVIAGRVVGRGRPEPLYVSLKLFRLLRALNPDVVIVGGYSMPAIYAALYCCVRGTPLILWSEGTPASEAALSAHQNVARSVLTRAASGAVAASTDASERFAELGVAVDRIFVAPYALDVAERPYRHFDETAPVRLLFVAQLIPRKGLSRLLRALALPSLSELHLTVAGSGPDRDDLETMARSLDLGERVRFLGFVAQEDLSAPLCKTRPVRLPDARGHIRNGDPGSDGCRASGDRVQSCGIDPGLRPRGREWVDLRASTRLDRGGVGASAATASRMARRRATQSRGGEDRKSGSFRTPATRRCEPSVGGITGLRVWRRGPSPMTATSCQGARLARRLLGGRKANDIPRQPPGAATPPGLMEACDREAMEVRPLLIIAPTPPPVHGVSMMTDHIRTALLELNLLAGHVDTRDPRPHHTIGRLDFRNVWLAFYHAWALHSSLRRKRSADVYIPISQSTLGYLRDALLIA